VKWERIVGIIEPGGIVGVDRCNGGDCVVGTPAPWTARSGSAEVDLDNGRVEFKVRGLVVAGDPSFANLGTTSVITMVKGTLLCNDTANDTTDVAQLVDTDAVPLSAQGNAYFQGRVDLPASCTEEPDDIVFLIRIADAGDFPFLVDRYLAFGAVRILTSH
jgi:hypothetical protein